MQSGPSQEDVKLIDNIKKFSEKFLKLYEVEIKALHDEYGHTYEHEQLSTINSLVLGMAELTRQAEIRQKQNRWDRKGFIEIMGRNIFNILDNFPIKEMKELAKLAKDDPEEALQRVKKIEELVTNYVNDLHDLNIPIAKRFNREIELPERISTAQQSSHDHDTSGIFKSLGSKPLPPLPPRKAKTTAPVSDNENNSDYKNNPDYKKLVKRHDALMRKVNSSGSGIKKYIYGDKNSYDQVQTKNGSMDCLMRKIFPIFDDKNLTELERKQKYDQAVMEIYMAVRLNQGMFKSRLGDVLEQDLRQNTSFLSSDKEVKTKLKF